MGLPYIYIFVSLDSLFDGPVCGNGFTEPGEHCDCGLPESCNNPCCDATTCKLHNGTLCAGGECCDLKVGVLRKNKNLCTYLQFILIQYLFSDLSILRTNYPMSNRDRRLRPTRVLYRRLWALPWRHVQVLKRNVFWRTGTNNFIWKISQDNFDGLFTVLINLSSRRWKKSYPHFQHEK